MKDTREQSCTCGERFPPEALERGGSFQCGRCGRQNWIEPSAGEMTAFVTPPAAADSGIGSKPVRPDDTTRDAPETLGPYRLQEIIGRGGMGTVYRAIDDQLRRDVAVKVLASEYRGQQDFVVRFDREARAAARINHRNLVQIYFTGVENGIPFFAMEHIRGSNLQDLVSEEGVLSPGRAVDLMIQAAEGLRAAATGGVIHRDIKPTNLLLQEDGTLKIADFGLAKSIGFDSRLTHTGAVVGTPYYMSPEQGKGEVVDHRSDIYALGATFYHLLAGDPPFSADSPVGIIVKHINDAPEPLRSRRREIPATLESIVLRMMAKDPDHRYPDYDALIADLAASRSGSLVNLSSVPAKKGTRAKGQSTFVVLDAPPPEIHLKKAGIVRWLLATSVDIGVVVGLERFSWWIGDQGFLGLESFDFLRLCAVALVGLFYFVALDAQGGQTVGKAMLRLRVGTVDGEELGLARATLRFVLLSPLLFAAFIPMFVESGGAAIIASGTAEWRAVAFEPTDVTAFLQNLLFIALVYSFLDLVYGFLTGEKRALHDAITGTFVYRQLRPKAPPTPPPPPAHKVSRKADFSNASLPPPPPQATPTVAPSTGAPPPPPGPNVRRKGHPNPQYAAMMSLVPGLGQVYNGQFFRGLVFFALTVPLVPFGVGVFLWIYAVWHAFQAAKTIQRERRGEAVRP